MIAALPMYDWPEASAANDAFWTHAARALRAAGIDAPLRLSRGGPAEALWTDDALLVGQTCGLPYVSGRCGAAVLAGRPSYAVEGAGDGSYRSALVCRTDDGDALFDFRGRRAAVNQYGSQSGCNALANRVRELSGTEPAPFFGAVLVSGANRASGSMVADGKADLAAIDAVAWALYAVAEPERRARLKVLEWTPAMPALPFITAPGRAGYVAAIVSALDLAARQVSHLAVPASVRATTDHDYDPVREMKRRVAGMRLAPDQPPV